MLMPTSLQSFDDPKPMIDKNYDFISGKAKRQPSARKLSFEHYEKLWKI